MPLMPKSVRLMAHFVRIQRRSSSTSAMRLLSLPLRSQFGHGKRRRKKLAGVVARIGIIFEKAPVPSKVPVIFVVQVIGGDRFVVVSQV